MDIELIEIVIGTPILLLFAGLINNSRLPDWLVATRVEGSRVRYFLLTYIAFVACVPVIYFGGEFIRANSLGTTYSVFFIVCPLAFLLKYFFIRYSKIKFRS